MIQTRTLIFTFRAILLSSLLGGLFSLPMATASDVSLGTYVSSVTLTDKPFSAATGGATNSGPAKFMAPSCSPGFSLNIDQDNNGTDGYVSAIVGGQNVSAQSLTAGVTGTLVQVRTEISDLSIFNVLGKDLTLKIVAGGNPSPPQVVLATKTVITSGYDVFFELDTPIPLVAGQQFTLIFSSTVESNLVATGGYGSEARYFSQDGGATFSGPISPYFSFDFTTYMCTENDIIDPTAICPLPITVSTDPGQCGAAVGFNLNVTDNKPGATISANISSGSFFATGTTTVTATAIDAAGNTDMCTFTVTVNDTEAPTAVCPTNITQGNDLGQCGAIVTYDVSAMDNCAGATAIASPASGSFFPVGTTTVTVTATDAAGNPAECTFDVTVNDTEDPMIDCAAELFVNNDPGVCEATINLPAPDPSDNCGIDRFEYRYVEVDEDNNELGAFTLFEDVTSGATITLPVGRYRIRFQVYDAAGNKVGCNQFVTVTDNEAPLITACTGTTVNFNGEESFNSEEVIDFAAMDNCGIASIVYDPPLISCEDLGSTVTVTVTVTDIYGNPNSCTADVVVDGLPCGFMDFGEDGIGCEDSNEVNYDVPSASFTLESEGCYTGNFTQDDAAYVKAEMCGNGEIIAHITSINPLGQGWAGITMRESEAPGAKKVELLVNLGNLIRRAVRTTTNGYAGPAQFFRPGATWLKLVRTGNQFLGYASTNGTNWQLVLGVAVPMNTCIQAGLMVTNYNGNAIVTGTFDNVSVNGSGNMNLQIPTTDHNLPEATQLLDFSFFPNPATSEVQVDLSAFAGQEAVLRIYNQVGQVLVQSRVEEAGFQPEKLDLNQLPLGTYFLEVISGEYRQVKKLLKTGL